MINAPSALTSQPTYISSATDTIENPNSNPSEAPHSNDMRREGSTYMRKGACIGISGLTCHALSFAAPSMAAPCGTLAVLAGMMTAATCFLGIALDPMHTEEADNAAQNTSTEMSPSSQTYPLVDAVLMGPQNITSSQITLPRATLVENP